MSKNSDETQVGALPKQSQARPLFLGQELVKSVQHLLSH